MLNILQFSLRVHDHGPELVNRKWSLIKTNSFLYEENWPGRGKFDQDGRQQQQRSEEDEQYQRQREVERPLNQRGPAFLNAGGMGDQVGVPEIFRPGEPVFQIEQV